MAFGGGDIEGVEAASALGDTAALAFLEERVTAGDRDRPDPLAGVLEGVFLAAGERPRDPSSAGVTLLPGDLARPLGPGDGDLAPDPFGGIAAADRMRISGPRRKFRARRRFALT